MRQIHLKWLQWQGEKKRGQNYNVKREKKIHNINDYIKTTFHNSHLFLFCLEQGSVFSCCCQCKPHISKRETNHQKVGVKLFKRMLIRLCTSVWISCAKWAHQLPLSNVLIPVHIVLYHLLQAKHERLSEALSGSWRWDMLHGEKTAKVAFLSACQRKTGQLTVL